MSQQDANTQISLNDVFGLSSAQLDFNCNPRV
jgi:hypothetical protein